jgi:hypothetical protein
MKKEELHKEIQEVNPNEIVKKYKEPPSIISQSVSDFLNNNKSWMKQREILYIQNIVKRYPHLEFCKSEGGVVTFRAERKGNYFELNFYIKDRK